MLTCREEPGIFLQALLLFNPIWLKRAPANRHLFHSFDELPRLIASIPGKG